MYFKLLLLLLLWLGWVNLVIFLLLINLTVNTFGKKFFAGFCTSFAEDYNKFADPFKIELFKDLNDMKPGEKISVLEIGAGPGANFKYYNRDMNIQSVEPNHNFESHFVANRNKYPKLEVKDLKIGYGEDLGAAEDQAKCLREIKRVLKPGGKFFYMEHILDDTEASIRIAQKCFTSCGFWAFACDGCCLDRSTAEAVENAGFAKVDQKKYDLPLSDLMSPLFKLVRIFIKRHVMGVATK